MTLKWLIHTMIEVRKIWGDGNYAFCHRCHTYGYDGYSVHSREFHPSPEPV